MSFPRKRPFTKVSVSGMITTAILFAGGAAQSIAAAPAAVQIQLNPSVSCLSSSSANNIGVDFTNVSGAAQSSPFLTIIAPQNTALSGTVHGTETVSCTGFKAGGSTATNELICSMPDEPWANGDAKHLSLGVTLPVASASNQSLGITNTTFDLQVFAGYANSTTAGPVVISTPVCTTGGPHLTLQKSAVFGQATHSPSEIKYGEVFSYGLVVTNDGDSSTSAGIVVTDTIPPSLEALRVFALSSDGRCSLDVATVSCSTSDQLPPHDRRAYVVVVKDNSLAPGPISNMAFVQGGGDPSSSSPKPSNTFTLNSAPAGQPFDCLSNSTSLCLGQKSPDTVREASLESASGGRFQIQVSWDALKLGTSGTGNAVPLTSDTGYFWFFGPNAVELVVKIVDGRALNGKFWVFYGALTDVQYIINVVDSVTGEVAGYFNPQDHQAGNGDTSAFPNAASAASAVQTSSEFEFIPMNFSGNSTSAALSSSPSSPEAIVSPCVADATTLCLKGNRFKVKVAWQALHLGTSGNGNAVPLPTSAGTDTGYFWFFGSTAVELLCKVVDGTALNGKFWFFYGALSDVQYTITVTDTQTGAVKTYTNPQDHLGSLGDTTAFSP